MKNLIVLAVATLFATNAVAAEMKWNGSAGWRFSNTSNSDGLNSYRTVGGTGTQADVSTTKTKAHQMRANLGVTGGWEHVEYGIGLRTGSSATTDDFVTVNSGQDLSLGVEQAWFRYTRDFGSVDMAATIGRQKLALATDTQWETLFDNDARLDGFGWNFKFGMFGFNAAQYILGTSTSNTDLTANGAVSASTNSYTDYSNSNAATRKHFATLFAFQPYMNWKFSDEIEAMFAIAYYRWNAAYTNTTGGGVTVNNNTIGSVPAITSGTLRMDGLSQWDFLANVNLPYNLMLTGDLVKANKAVYNNLTVGGYLGNVATEVGSSAWTLGLVYGKLRKAQDFTVGYAYGTKGIGSMMNAFTNDKFLADNKGHTVMVGYAMADNFHLGFRWMSLEEKERVDVSTAAGSNGANLQGRPYQGSSNANGNQKNTTKYWELTAGVAF